jgi:hypothetical protein
MFKNGTGIRSGAPVPATALTGTPTVSVHMADVRLARGDVITARIRFEAPGVGTQIDTSTNATTFTARLVNPE